MLVGGDFGFSLFFVLAAGLFVPVIGFVVRRKWRLTAARREDIKRLLVLASEEAARAELEATVGCEITTVATPPPRQLRYQCALCFCPTTTRCARCKAVWYCSGKCQIIHWRQGHKDECRPCDPGKDVGDNFGLKVYEEDDCSSIQTEGRQHSTPSEAVPREYSFSKQHGWDNAKSQFAIMHLLNGKFSGSTTSDELSGQAPVSSSNYSDESPGTQSATLNHVSETCLDRDVLCGTSSSSGWSVDCSNDSALSEPSTPSSGFWEGTIDTNRSRINSLDDCARSSSSESGDGNITDHLSSLNVSIDLDRSVVSSVDAQGPNAKILISDSACPSLLVAKEPIDGSTLSEQTKRDNLNSRSITSLGAKTLRHTDGHDSSDLSIMKSRGLVFSSSHASYAHPSCSSRGHSLGKDSLQVSSLLPLSTETSDTGLDGTNTSLALKFREEVRLTSKTTDANLSSANGRLRKIDCASEATASLTQFTDQTQNARNGLKISMLKVNQLRVSKLSRKNPSEAGSEIGIKYNNKGLFSYKLFVKLYNSNKAALHPFGLMNCGNSCYANAVLQCLTFTPPLTAYLLEGLHSKSCLEKEWCFTCELESLVMKAKEGYSPLSPTCILSQIQNLGSHLGNGREEDAHEFLRYAIDAMQSVCLKESGVDASGSLEDETTLIGLTFGGYLRSKIQCLKCGGKSERHERMMDLTVEIEGDIGTLEEALRQFTGTEILDGENKYQCCRCKSYEKAKKKLMILEAPNVLTIALKRFQSGKFGKLNKSIQFPEILDLAPYMSGTSDKSPIYSLYGVVVHLDVMNAAFSGHYVCYVKNIQNKWFKIDDSAVKSVEIEMVLGKGAYMLLYARCSPRAPRLVRSSLIPRDPKNPKTPTKSRTQSAGSWDCSMGDSSNHCSNTESFYASLASSEPVIWGEDSSSDYSSCFFSETGSCSTESRTRGSVSTDGYVDQIFGDVGHNWNNQWRNSSDSDTSCCSTPSPLHLRHSPLGHMDRYVSRCPETCAYLEYGESVGNLYSVRARIPRNGCEVEGLEFNGHGPFMCSDSSKYSGNLGSSSNCRETNSCRFGRVNPLENLKSGVSFRRSMRERTN